LRSLSRCIAYGKQHLRLPYIALVLLVLHLATAILHAQVQIDAFDCTNLHEATPLGITWLVHPGDDPAYARPDLDDRDWLRFNPNTDIKLLLTGDRPEVVWYRLHVKVSPSETGLALLEHQISSAFEVYVNREKLMEGGHVAPYVPHTFAARRIERIPDSMIASGSLVIALRVHISRTEWGSDGPGYAAENLELGQQSSLREHLTLSILSNSAVSWALQILGLGLGIVALVLFSAQRQQIEYLWIFLQFFCSFCMFPISLIEATHDLPIGWDLLRQSLNLISFFFQILMFLAFLRTRLGWWGRSFCAVTAIGMVLSAVGQAQGTIPVLGVLLAQIPLLALVAGVLPVQLAIHWRRGNREAGILLIPILLSSISIYAALFLFALSKIPAFAKAAVRWNISINNLPIGPFVVSLQQLGILMYMLSLAIIMVLRSTTMSRRQALLEGEVEAAREVQQVILPEQIESIPCFSIESVYQPAQQVGGDFFQILPTSDGGLLLVLGDVAGKGLPAAMLVSVLVGAIRTAAGYTNAPEEMLAQLNERLIGRANGGFSTALAAHISSVGTVTIANAGHLSPYLDGQEIEFPARCPSASQAGQSTKRSSFSCTPAAASPSTPTASSRLRIRGASYSASSAGRSYRRGPRQKSLKQRSSSASPTTSPSWPSRGMQL
jgi:sigma-B regulation protein RsbU (phosphoserine phosphatase)